MGHVVIALQLHPGNSMKAANDTQQPLKMYWEGRHAVIEDCKHPMITWDSHADRTLCSTLTSSAQ